MSKNSGTESKVKILIVDDEKDIREALSHHLSKIGYRTKEASDGAQCISAVKKFKPDAILLDLNMPNMNGVQVLRSLRNLGVETPVLIISGLSDIGPYVESRELGLGEFIEKPFRLNEVSMLLETALLEASDETGQPINIPRRTGL